MSVQLGMEDLLLLLRGKEMRGSGSRGFLISGEANEIGQDPLPLSICRGCEEENFFLGEISKILIELKWLEME